MKTVKYVGSIPNVKAVLEQGTINVKYGDVIKVTDKDFAGMKKSPNWQEVKSGKKESTKGGKS